MTLAELTELMHSFVNEKGWYAGDSIHPQTPRNLSASLAIESAEVLEFFQWSETLQEADKSALAAELADVGLYLLQLASITGIDLERAIIEKLHLNQTRTWDK
ncbi:MAG: nucleotide pyrophosphohydrolase [Anaerolineae bacterium]|nr:nucleotide pyrophosphohydrolase [Anaerolineae bacterium]